MAKNKEKEAEFKSALRRAILSGSNLIRNELKRGTRFVYSEQYPTQVLNTRLGRFIRVNESDIDPDTIDNLLKLMMGIDTYITMPEREAIDESTGSTITIPAETQDLSEVLSKAVDKVKTIDYIDLNMSDLDDFNDEDDYEYAKEEGNILTYDSFHNITGLHGITLEPQLIHLPSKLDEVEEEFDPSKIEPADESLTEDSSATDMTESCETLAAAADSDGDGKSPDKMKIPQEILVEQALNDIEQYKGISAFHSNKSILTKQDLIKLEPKVKQLLKAFQGVGGQEKLVTPTKRMSSKDIASDRDKCYIRKTGTKGKHIKMNLLIDMSGSMSGDPVKNAVRLVYLFNQLAKKEYVTMSVLYSTTSTNFKITLPISDAEVLSLCKVQSAEGLAKTIHAHADTIRGVNTICITDGDIVDEPIDKMFWAKHKSISTGVYVNPSIKDYREYSGKLNKWFNHSVVRKSLDELIEWLIRVGLKG